MGTNSLTIPILHFNDVYNITRAESHTNGSFRVMNKAGELHNNIDHVIRFASKIETLRNSWAEQKKKCLLLFSGDVFSASVESMLTRGRSMVHLMNELLPDACVPGNHELDYGRERFNQLVEFCNFPWVLSNAEEETQDKKWVTLKDLHRHRVLEVVVDGQELRIGIIGLISKDTYAKMDVRASSTFKPLDMEEKCMELAAELRGKEKCDLVFALTHALHGEDIKLGKRVNAYTAARFSELSGHNLEDTPGVDLILGGHDHDYYLGGGVELESTTGPGVERPAILPNDDELLIIKSGTDFEDLSEVQITVEDRRNGKERKKVVTSVKVIRHRDPGLANQGTGVETPQQCRMTEILNRILDNEVITNLKKPVARLPPEIATSVLVNQDEASRRGETVLGNWIADSMIRWYHRHRASATGIPPDLIFITTGGSIRFRSGAEPDPEKILQGDIIRLLPFGTPLVTLRITGRDLRSVFECALGNSSYDPQDPMKHTRAGSFPVVSGIRIKWKSTNNIGERVISMELPSGAEVVQDDEHRYNILTHTYLSDGGDGLEPFKPYSRSVNSTDVPVFQALLQDISDTPIREAERILEQKQESEASLTEASEGSIPTSTYTLLGLLPFPVGPLIQVMAAIGEEDRPGLVIEKIWDHVVKFAEANNLPKLDIPLKVDGRMEDATLKEGGA